MENTLVYLLYDKLKCFLIVRDLESLIKIPTPEFFVFYNGKEKFPVEKTLKLSEAYIEKTENPILELTVKIININFPVNHPILQKCRPLYEYSWFIQRIREYESNGCGLSEAITFSIEDCKKEDIMTGFIRENGSEAVNMLFTQFNMEDALEVRYEEGVEQGIQQGIEEGGKKTAKETAIAMLQKGNFSIEEIAEYVPSLTLDEIQALQGEKK